VATFYGAGDLRDDEGGGVELGVFVAVVDPGAGVLLGCGDAGVGDEVAVDGVGVVGVEDELGEVGAVVEEEIEVADVFAVVEDGDEAGVLLGDGVDFKAVDGAVVRGADELGPLTLGSFAFFVVGGEVFEVVLAVGVADFGDLLFGDGGGDIGGVVDGVEVGDEGDGDPVEAVDLVVAADDDAVFAVVAGAEDGGGVRTDVVEVDGGVAGGVEGAEGAVGLFHEKSDGGVGLGCTEAKEEKRGSDEGVGSFVAGVHFLLDAGWGWDGGESLRLWWWRGDCAGGTKSGHAKRAMPTLGAKNAPNMGHPDCATFDDNRAI